ncbi:MAG: adenylate kinase [Saccharofermentans sp.]|nr:adenylate kinase [Saccharofermentans sp.]
MNLIILGAPGSGKGTTATVLREKYDLVHISTGDLFRYNLKENTPLGIEAKTYMDKGALVPDDVTIRMVEDRLSNPDCEKGYILDGFPRNIAQAEALDKMGAKIDAVVYVICDDEIIMDRVTTRRVCEKCGASFNVKYMPTKTEGICDVCGGNVIQRSDDNPETVAKRLETYRINTQPLIDFYNERGIIVEGNNNVDSETCIASIEAGLKKLGL